MTREAHREATGSPITPERLRMAGSDYAIGGDDRTGRRYHMRDTPLDRAHKRKIISGVQHSALQKYRLHWYRAAQAPHIASIDLDRVFASDGAMMPGMPATEHQAFHRARWREAQQEIGQRITAMVELIVCYEASDLEHYGYQLGWRNKSQAIAGASCLLQEAGYRLAKLWKIG